jgi:8-oxo-dGTP pyrophosphatase MutT (NUDIX family)
MKGSLSSKQIRQGIKIPYTLTDYRINGLNHIFKFLDIKLEDMEDDFKNIRKRVKTREEMSFPWHNTNQSNQSNHSSTNFRNTVHQPNRRYGVRTRGSPGFHLSWNTRYPRPQLGKTEVYGAIIRCITTNRYCLVQGLHTGKWSFPKGHRNTLSTDPLVMEDPFACVIREVGEEIGVDNLPMPIREYPIRVGYYYMFEVNYELALHPRDLIEIGTANWFTIEEMKDLNLNIDANVFRCQNQRERISRPD